jgi:hypothetical protein
MKLNNKVFTGSGYMAATFWSNTIWFIILGVLTAIEMFFVLYKEKNRKQVIALFLIISGMTFCIEATICCFLKAYNYYPMIIPRSPINDNLAGNLFSQFSITSTALLIAVFKLKYYWIFALVGVYAIIEELFLKLGIYSHNWYRTWMTIPGFITLFWITKQMYKSRLLYNNRNWRYFFMLFGLYTLHMPTAWWIQILSGIIVLNTKILPDTMNSFALISLINLFILSIVCMVIYFSKLKLLWKSIVTMALYGVIYYAYKINIIYVKEGWFMIFSTIDIFGMYLYIFILDKLITNKTQRYPSIK